MGLRDVNQATIALVKQFEGLPAHDPATGNFNAYLDPVNIWTIGWGHAITYQGRFLKGDADKALVASLYPNGITLQQAENLLHTDLMNAGRDVSAAVHVSLNDNEFGALTSFTFNLGISNLLSSTLLKKLNANDRAGAADQFSRWVMANGQSLPGLVKRRAAERSLFLLPV
ncbi:lysozyme [Undibacterium sp. Ji67W]|uniref:lysozyme n=1 Tax=Undibacterium sp. Ji67W TaxID=3413042 RepID=UPI003BF2CEF8